MSNEELAIQKKNGNADQLPALFAQVEAFVNMKAEQAARKLPPSFGQTVDDLRQCGWLALYDAVEKFDPDRGVFLTALSFALKQQFASLWFALPDVTPCLRRSPSTGQRFRTIPMENRSSILWMTVPLKTAMLIISPAVRTLCLQRPCF